MSVQTQINRINTEVADQSALLDQAIAALQGKAAGGESGGGLPEGISALSTGTVTVASDTTYTMIEHGLGVVPTFLAWVMEESSSSLTSAAVSGGSTFKTIASTYVQYYIRGLSSSGSPGGTSSGALATTSYMTTTQARIMGNSTFKIVAGKTYRWVCGVMDGVL